MSSEEHKQPSSSQDYGSEGSALSRFDVMPGAEAVNVGYFSVFRRVRQVFRRSGVQVEDASAFFDNKLDLYLD